MRIVSCALAFCSVPATALAPSDGEIRYDPRRNDQAAISSEAATSLTDASSSAIPHRPPSTEGLAPQADDTAILLRASRDIVKTRNRRGQHLRGELFAEPAWDMLLDLFVAHLEGRRVYVTSLCIAANAPTSTALRYIQDMLKNGEILSASDPKDGRRRWLSLAENTVVAMTEIVRAFAMSRAGSGSGQPGHYWTPQQL